MSTTGSTDDVDRRATALAMRDAAREAEELRQFFKVRRFGTRRDGRPYPKGSMPTVEFAGKTALLEKYDSVLRYFRELAVRNGLPESYAYHLIGDLSESTLMVRFKLDRAQARGLRDLAQEYDREANR